MRRSKRQDVFLLYLKAVAEILLSTGWLKMLPRLAYSRLPGFLILSHLFSGVFDIFVVQMRGLYCSMACTHICDLD